MSSRVVPLALLLGVTGALGAGCEGRPRTHGTPLPAASSGEPEPGPGLVLELDLTQGAPEANDPSSLFPRPAARSFTGLVRALESAAVDARPTGYFVRLGTASLGWARTEEVGRLLERLKSSGKPVVCHAHSLDNSSLWLLLRGCTRVWLSPAGDADAVGLAAQTVHLKGAFDKLGVRADFLHQGRYKSAAEMFTHEEPSADAKEALLGVLGSVRQTWLEGAAQARPAQAELRTRLEGGPYSAEEARHLGLVDAVGYESDALRELRELAKAGRSEQVFGSKAARSGRFDLAELMRILTGADERTAGRPHLVVVPLQGPITLEGGGLFDSGGIAASATTRTLRRLARDPSVRAVVLRIDSPGGSALASDLLWHEITELSRQKPVVASVGEMAASGGYYLAVGAGTIVAERTSIIGSIGVVGGKLTLDEALRARGINAVTLSPSPEAGGGARAAWASPLTPWDEPTRERVGAQMAAIYELFLDRVARGRGRPKEEIRKVAEGRIWSGAVGLGLGLVDELGGLERATALARERAGLDPKAPVRVEGAQQSLLEALMLEEGASETEVEAAALRWLARRDHWRAALPPALVPWVAALEPLVRGERVLTVLPWVVLR